MEELFKQDYFSNIRLKTLMFFLFKFIIIIIFKSYYYSHNNCNIKHGTTCGDSLWSSYNNYMSYIEENSQFVIIICNQKYVATNMYIKIPLIT